MEIISHRGYWLTPEEKNTRIAFERSFSMGFGTETDVRDACGRLVISHDMPGNDDMSVEEFFKIFVSFDRKLPLALNIKSDGLQDKLKSLLDSFNIENYFLFDMSIPDLLKSVSKNLKCYARISEYEILTTELSKVTSGVWLDYFQNFSLKKDEISSLLVGGKDVCLVSPELHGKAAEDFWSELKSSKLDQNKKLMICTDLPEAVKQILT